MSKGKKYKGSRQAFQDGTCAFAKVQYYVLFCFHQIELGERLPSMASQGGGAAQWWQVCCHLLWHLGDCQRPTHRHMALWHAQHHQVLLREELVKAFFHGGYGADEASLQGPISFLLSAATGLSNWNVWSIYTCRVQTCHLTWIAYFRDIVIYLLRSDLKDSWIDSRLLMLCLFKLARDHRPEQYVLLQSDYCIPKLKWRHHQ